MCFLAPEWITGLLRSSFWLMDLRFPPPSIFHRCLRMSAPKDRRMHRNACMVNRWHSSNTILVFCELSSILDIAFHWCQRIYTCGKYVCFLDLFWSGKKRQMWITVDSPDVSSADSPLPRKAREKLCMRTPRARNENNKVKRRQQKQKVVTVERFADH